jgi:hypothetical protein
LQARARQRRRVPERDDNPSGHGKTRTHHRGFRWFAYSIHSLDQLLQRVNRYHLHGKWLVISGTSALHKLSANCRKLPGSGPFRLIVAALPTELSTDPGDRSLRPPTRMSGGLPRLVQSVPRCSLRGRSGARRPRHALGAARGSGWLCASHPLRCAPRLGRCQVGTGKQALSLSLSLIGPESWFQVSGSAICFCSGRAALRFGRVIQRQTHPIADRPTISAGAPTSQ